MGKHSSNVLTLLWTAIGCSLLASPGFAQSRAKADTIITHARVYTVNRSQPWAEAIAIKDQHIAAVGGAK